MNPDEKLRELIADHEHRAAIECLDMHPTIMCAEVVARDFAKWVLEDVVRERDEALAKIAELKACHEQWLADIAELKAEIVELKK